MSESKAHVVTFEFPLQIIYEDLPEGDGWDDEQDACESRPSSKGARGKHGPNKFKSSSSQHFKSSHVPLKASMQHFKDFPRSNLFDGRSFPELFEAIVSYIHSSAFISL